MKVVTFKRMKSGEQFGEFSFRVNFEGSVSRKGHFSSQERHYDDMSAVLSPLTISSNCLVINGPTPLCFGIF